MTWDVLRYDTVDSTNNVCKALAAQGLDSTAVIARAQTAGKGRLGRSFQSPEGGLYLSALWQDCPAGQLLTVTPLAAVAVCRAVESLCDTDCGIKWCNDVVLHGKKLCGILTELSCEAESGRLEYAVIGIGVNCNTRLSELPPEVQKRATSLREAVGREIDVNALAAAMIARLQELDAVLRGDRGPWMREYREACVTLGKQVLLLRAGESRPAFALDVDDDAGLIVRYEDGTIGTVSSGEVSVRGIY